MSMAEVEVEVSYTRITEGADHSDPCEDGIMRSYITVVVPDGEDIDAYASRVALEEAAMAGWLDPSVDSASHVE